jgi:hypothetical protein
MATKSVIEIELIDDQFKAFSAQLKAMQAIIGSMPEQWKAVTKEVNEEQKAEAKAANEAEKARKKKIQEEKDFNKIIEDRKKAFMDAAYFTGNIAKNLASGALSIAKWMTFAAVGGGFGLGGLASSASDYRKRAQGLGTTTGALRAAESNLGSYIDVQSVLSNMATLQHDITQSFYLGRLGGRKQGDPLDQLQTVMSNAIKDFKAHGQDLNYAQNVGLTKVFSPEELIRLSALSAEELEKTWKQLAKDREAMKLSDATSRLWQEFWNKLKTATNTIEVAFIKNLTALIPQLKELSETIVKAITNLLSSKKFQEAVTKFANYLGSDDFKENIATFFEALKKIGEAAYNAAVFLGLIDKKATTEDYEPGRKTSEKTNFKPVAAGGGELNMEKAEAYLTQVEKTRNLPAGVLDKIWFVESSRGTGAMLSEKGAMGHFQHMPEVAKAYHEQNPYDFQESAEVTGNILSDLLKEFKGNKAEALAAYNWGSGNLEHYLKGDKGYEDKAGKYHQTSQIPDATIKYLHNFGINVTVTNNTDTNLAIKALSN